MGAYLTALAGRGVTTVLLRPGDPVIDAGGPGRPWSRLPAGIDEVLGAGGLGPVGGTTGAATLDPDGTVREADDAPRRRTRGTTTTRGRTATAGLGPAGVRPRRTLDWPLGRTARPGRRNGRDLPATHGRPRHGSRPRTTRGRCSTPAPRPGRSRVPGTGCTTGGPTCCSCSPARAASGRPASPSAWRSGPASAPAGGAGGRQPRAGRHPHLPAARPVDAADHLGGRRDRRPGPGDRAAREADRRPAPAAAGTALRAW